MASVFIKVDPKKRLPEKDGMVFCISEDGQPFITLHNVGFAISNSAAYWLEEINMPNEEELNKFKPKGDKSLVDIHDSAFYAGINYVLNMLK